MSIVNQKGGFVTSLRITRNNVNTSNTTLKTPLLKKSENYACQITDFFINKTPDIFPDELWDQPHIEIINFVPPPAIGVQQPVPYIDIAERTFRPQRCKNVMDYFAQLQKFFKQYSHVFRRTVTLIEALGADPHDYSVLPNDSINFLMQEFIGGVNVGFGGKVDAVSVRLDSTLRVVLKCTPGFLRHFYIKINSSVATALNLPTELFSVDILGANYTAPQPDQPLLNALGILNAHYLNVIAAPATNKLFTSVFTLNALDFRKSLDVWVSMPIANHIECLNGKEELQHTIARFDLTNMKKFETSYTIGSEGFSVHEHFASGMENLTRQNPDFEGIHMMPGILQAVNVRLLSRWFDKSTKKLISQDSDLTDGLWHLRLLFSKKT